MTNKIDTRMMGNKSVNNERGGRPPKENAFLMASSQQYVSVRDKLHVLFMF